MIATPEQELRDFRVVGNHRTAYDYVWGDRETRRGEFVQVGPAGTGKSRVGLELAAELCTTFPGCRGLLVRKTRASLTESVCVTWENKVLWPDHPAVRTGGRPDNRSSYTFPWAESYYQGERYAGESHVALCGLDKPERTFSTEYDWIYVEEMIELTRAEWFRLFRANRNGYMPFQVMFGSTNPGPTFHWIKRLMDEGKLPFVESTHKDNPTYWDPDADEWTEEGFSYVEGKLERIAEPHEYKRLKLGEWVAKEGLIYRMFDPSVHCINADELPEIVWTFASMDFGLRNAGSLSIWGVDARGAMYQLAQIYRKGMAPDWWAERVVELRDEFKFKSGVCDPARPDLILQLNQYLGWPGGRPGPRYMHAADNSVHAGIRQVAEMLRPSSGEAPLLFFVRENLRHGPEPSHVEAGRPTSTVEEMQAYVWKDPPAVTAGRQEQDLKEEPLKKDDHGCDELRYAAMFQFARNVTPRKKGKQKPEMYTPEWWWQQEGVA